jgi:hypothetical protein
MFPKEPRPPLKESALVAKIVKKLRIHREGFWFKVREACGRLWDCLISLDAIKEGSSG